MKQDLPFIALLRECESIGNRILHPKRQEITEAEESRLSARESEALEEYLLGRGFAPPETRKDEV